MQGTCTNEEYLVENVERESAENAVNSSVSRVVGLPSGRDGLGGRCSKDVKGEAHHISDFTKASVFLFHTDIRAAFGRCTDATYDVFFLREVGPTEWSCEFPELQSVVHTSAGNSCPPCSSAPCSSQSVSQVAARRVPADLS